MFASTASATRRRVTRLGIGVGVVIGATVCLPGAAQAHVTVQPGTAEGGDFSVIAFRVPNERDDASTTQMRVTLPEEQPIGSVQTTPVAGWKVTTKNRKLEEPIDLFGEKLDTVVSTVTWTATGGGIQPGQFQDFDLSLGPLPESGDLVFNARQTYSSGETVDWNEVAADGTTEPEHPAPTLSLAPAAADGATGTDQGAATTGEAGEATSADQADTTAAITQDDEGSSSALAIGMSAAALVLSVLAAALAWRSGRRPAQAAGGTSSSPREGVHV